MKDDLTALLPDYADVYFDNVGGETLDIMLALVKRFGFVGVCGGISSYNATDPEKLANWAEVIFNRLTIQGQSMHLSFCSLFSFLCEVCLVGR